MRKSTAGDRQNRCWQQERLGGALKRQPGCEARIPVSVFGLMLLARGQFRVYSIIIVSARSVALSFIGLLALLSDVAQWRADSGLAIFWESI